MKKSLLLVCLFTVALATSLRADTTVVFNEIMYHPASPDTVEFIELKNTGAAAINLAGCRFADGEPFDVAVATWWETTSQLFTLSADRYAYFVQSLEDRFFELGDPRADLARVMVAMQQSQVAFRATVEVRNRLVQAYQDVMNMPI